MQTVVEAEAAPRSWSGLVWRRGVRNRWPWCRSWSWLGAVGAALVIAAAGASPVAGHVEHEVGGRFATTQAVGPYELRLAIELPVGVSGPLYVDLTPEDVTAEGEVRLAVVPAGGEGDGRAESRLALAPGDPGPYTARLAVAGAGAWELLVRVAGPAGEGEARIPFTVAEPAGGVAVAVLRVALGALGGVLMVAIALVGSQARGRLVPRWLPLALSHGAVACLVVATGAGIAHVVAPPADRVAGEAPAARPHVNLLLGSEPAAPAAGEPVALALDLSDGATGRPVDDLVVHHEALVHGVLIGDDGGFFAHVHPARVGVGRFRVEATPDRAGAYTFYAEVTRRDGGSQVVSAPLIVTGEAGAAAAPALPPPLVGRHRVDDLEVAASVDGGVARAGEAASIDFRIGRDGRRVAALQPWLGMAGHLIVRAVDRSLFAHVHAAGPMADGGLGGSGSGEARAVDGGIGVRGVAIPFPRATPGSTRLGPEVRFTYAFPRAGSYLVWFQFKEADRVRTLPVRVDVEEGV